MRICRCAVLIASLSALIESSDVARAALFTPGNLVVYRINPATANASEVFIDEYSPSGAFVQTINMPTTAAGSQRALTGAGSENASGTLNRSADGQYIVVPGYNAAVGTAAVSTTSSGTAAGAINRVVGRIDAAGNVDTSTAYTAFSGTAIRSVTSTDGTNVWASGGGATSQAVRFTTFGAVANGTQTSTTASVTPRVVEIYNNQLYISSTSGAALGISTVGSGTPQNTGNSITLTISSPAPHGFFLADLDAGVAGLDTAYIADESTFANGGGIRKYTFNGSAWTFNNVLGAAGDTYRGLTGIATANGVQLYATKQAGTNQGIYGVLDTAGYNANNNGTLSLVAAAPTGFIFRGIDFTPVAVPEASAFLCVGLVGILLGLGRHLLARKVA